MATSSVKRSPARPAAAKSPAPPAPKALTAELEFLRTLSDTVSVSGDEGAVRRLILEAIRPHVDSVQVDALGNVLAIKKGASARPADRVMLAAHMDEVGFMVSGHDSDGTLRFEVVGGIEEHLLIGKPVSVGPQGLPGVIGAAAIHLLSGERRASVVRAGQLRIDLGAETAEAAKRLVKLGERGTFASEFTVLGDYSLRGKALDDRLGCATLVELLRGGPYPCEVRAAFTVQEEVGLRGARVAGYALEPAAAFVLDCTPARDLPPALEGGENTQYNTRLGLGPAVYLADKSTLADQRLIRFIEQTAKTAGLPFQLRQPGGGGTDAGAIHRTRAGVPSLSISVPGRYIHSPATVARLDDWRQTVALLRQALLRWSPAALK